MIKLFFTMLISMLLFACSRTPAVDTKYVCGRLEKCLLSKNVMFSSEDRESCLATNVEADDVRVVSAFVLDCQELPDCAFVLCIHEHSTARLDAINRLSQ